MIREFLPDQADDIPGLCPILRAYLRDGPHSYAENAQVEMHLLKVDDLVLPLVFADPGASNADVCSPYAHYVRYTCEEIAKRRPQFPRWLLSTLFWVWRQLARKPWLDQSVYVNNWLFSTNPAARLSVAQVKAVTRFLRQHYPDRAIIFRTVTPSVDRRFAGALRESGYRLIPARTIHLLDTLPSNPATWKRNTRSDVTLLKQTRFRIMRAKDLRNDHAAELTQLYRSLYLDKHSRLNQHFNRRFFELAIKSAYFDGLILADGQRLVGMILFHQDQGLLLPQVMGYDLDYGRKDGLYRQLMAGVMLEAQSRGLTLHLSSGAGHFKELRGARAALEYEAIFTRGLPFPQRFAWKLMEIQGHAWAWRIQPDAEITPSAPE